MANITVRVEASKKQAAEQVTAKMGLTMSDAVKLFLDALIREDTIPFDVTLSKNLKGHVVHRMLDEAPNKKMMSTHIFAESLVAFQIKNAFGAKATRVSNNPVVDLVFSIGGRKYACIVKGRQFSNNESLQDKVIRAEVEELKHFAQREDCIPRVAFVMLDCDGTEGSTYIFDPADLDDLSKACVKGITGSLEYEGEVRVSNARRNRQDLRSNEKILSFYSSFESINSAAHLHELDTHDLGGSYG